MQSKQAKKFEGKKIGGGTTNKEKARKKNFLMLRKSSAVQGKLRRSFKEQGRVLTAKIKGDKKMDKRKKQVCCRFPTPPPACAHMVPF